MNIARRSIVLGIASLPAAAAGAVGSFDQLDAPGFERLLDRLAEGWNAGDAKAASMCFTEDAVYVEPPRKQLYRGRAELFTFFGGDTGRPGAMQMQWHRRVFDAARQQGMGEFSFRYGSQVHGVAVIDVARGLIAQWREYWYHSEEPFAAFVAPAKP